MRWDITESANTLISFGPNTFPAFNSCIFSLETQVAYVASTLVKPIIDGYASIVEAKHEAEEEFIQNLDNVLKDTVFSAGCSNWYLDKASGRNSAAWPGLAITFWQALYFPKWRDFHYGGGSSLWLMQKARRNLFSSTAVAWLVPLAAATWTAQNRQLIPIDFSNIVSQLRG